MYRRRRQRRGTADVTTDLDGNPRFADDPATPDTGNGTPPIVDMGAYEFSSAAPSGLYELTWSTIDGGGRESSGGPFVLTGTIGQPNAAWNSVGSFELYGGFQPGGP